MKIKSALERAQQIQNELTTLFAQRAKLEADHTKALADIDHKITVENGKLSIVIDTTLQNV